MLTPMATRTTEHVAEFIKSRWTFSSTNPKKLQWFATPLDANPSYIDHIITYGECETNTIYISVETQDNDSGLTSSVLQDMDFISARALIILGTAATRYTHATRFNDLDVETSDCV